MALQEEGAPGTRCDIVNSVDLSASAVVLADCGDQARAAAFRCANFLRNSSGDIWAEALADLLVDQGSRLVASCHGSFACSRALTLVCDVVVIVDKAGLEATTGSDVMSEMSP